MRSIRLKMYLALLATFFTSLSPTLSIPLEPGLSPSADMFSWSGDSDFFEPTTFLEPSSPDNSLTSNLDDFPDPSSPLSFFAENGGNQDDDLQSLLSSTDTSTFCPLGKRKRGSPGSCDSSEAPPPTLTLPNSLDTIFDTILNTPLGTEGDSEGAGVTTGEVGNDPCAIQVGYPVHVCCRGPPGLRVGTIYSTIENCRLG